jgi:hypothetical protein
VLQDHVRDQVDKKPREQVQRRQSEHGHSRQRQQSSGDVEDRTGQGRGQGRQNLSHHELERRCRTEQHFKYALHLIFRHRAQVRSRTEKNHHEQQSRQEYRHQHGLHWIFLFGDGDLPGGRVPGHKTHGFDGNVP